MSTCKQIEPIIAKFVSQYEEAIDHFGISLMGTISFVTLCLDNNSHKCVQITM